MADDDDYSCRQCNKGFLCLRTLRHHQALSTKCGQKRKLDELIDDDAPSDGDANGGDGPQQLQGACSERNVEPGVGANYDGMEELRLRLAHRIAEQRGDSFNPPPKPFSSFNPSIECAAIDPRGYFANRKPFAGNESEYLYGMHFVENPRNTAKAVNRLRDLLKRPDFDIDDVKMDQKTRMKRLYATIDDKDKFQKIPLYRDLGLADRSTQVHVYVRSLYAAACRLVDRYDRSEFDLHLERVYKDGVRVYNREICSTDRLQRTKAWVAEKYGTDVVTFPLYFGWDGVRFCSLFVRCSYNNRTIIVRLLYDFCTIIVRFLFVTILYDYCTVFVRDHFVRLLYGFCS
jgi:hypothetical protein